MRTCARLVSLAAALAFQSCGQLGSSSTDCADSVVLGTWADSQERITFGDDCSYSNTLCRATATVSNLTASSGTVTLSDYAVGDSSCSVPDVSQRTCTYSVSGSSLQFRCGTGSTHDLTKQ